MTTYALKTKQGSTKERFQMAVRDIRASGVVWYTNFLSCCNGCADIDGKMKARGIDPDSTPVGWFIKRDTKDGLNWTKDGDLAEVLYSRYYQKMVKKAASESLVLYISHDDGGKGDGFAGSAIRDAFLVHGFDVKWDGTSSQTVIVTIPAAE